MAGSLSEMLGSLAKKAPGQASGETEAEEPAESPALQVDDALIGAADDVRAALTSRDSEEFAEALKAFVSMC